MRWENATPSFRVFLLIEDLVCKHGVVMVEGRNGGPGMGPLQSSNKHTLLVFPGVDVINHPNKDNGRKERYILSTVPGQIQLSWWGRHSNRSVKPTCHIVSAAQSRGKGMWGRQARAKHPP